MRFQSDIEDIYLRAQLGNKIYIIKTYDSEKWWEALNGETSNLLWQLKFRKLLNDKTVTAEYTVEDKNDL